MAKIISICLNHEELRSEAWNRRGLALESLDKTAEANEAYAKAEEFGFTG